MFWSKNKASREARDQLVASMPVDENGDVREEYLRARNDARSVRSRTADGRSTAKKVYPLRMSPEQAVSWVNNPGRSDVSGIDTQSPANIERRTKRAKGSAPAKPKGTAPTKPKAQTPTKPDGPIPSKSPGVIVSGKEITDVARLCGDADCLPMVLSNGVCSTTWEGTYGYALTRRDGKGLYGMDADESMDRFVYHAEEIAGLDPNATYKVSLEDDLLVFRTGRDFSQVALKEKTNHIGYIRTPEEMSNGCTPAMFEFDSAAVTLVLEKMAGAGVRECRLSSTKWGVSLSSNDGYFDFIIGPRMKGTSGSSVYLVAPFLTMMRALAPHVHSMGFCPDGAFTMKGEFGKYGLTAVMVRSADTATCSSNRKKRFKPINGRRNKR